MQNDMPVVVTQTYAVPKHKVWDALTNKDQMQQWYFKLDEFKPEPGFRFEFEGGTETTKYKHLCEVIDVVTGEKLTHSWQYDGYAGRSFVTWQLSDREQGTLVSLTHEKLETLPESNPDFKKENFLQGWTSILGTSLKNFLEETPVA